LSLGFIEIKSGHAAETLFNQQMPKNIRKKSNEEKIVCHMNIQSPKETLQ